MSIVPLVLAEDPSEFGGKAYHLGRAIRAGLPVPPGYAVSVAALDAVRRGEAEAIAKIGSVVGELGPPLAARSSAVGEDAEEASFAGQHVTCLNVTTLDSAVQGLSRVWDSAHAEAALAYRRKKNITAPIRVAAVVQKLVDSECAGVLFTRNPVTHAEEHVIEAAWGLGEGVVSGIVTPDHYRLARDGRVLEARVGEKDIAIRRRPDGGTEEAPVAAGLVEARCLDDGRLAELHALAVRCEEAFGPDLDLEWAFAGGGLYLLQSRPISTAQ